MTACQAGVAISEADTRSGDGRAGGVRHNAGYGASRVSARAEPVAKIIARRSIAPILFTVFSWGLPAEGSFVGALAYDGAQPTGA